MSKPTNKQIAAYCIEQTLENAAYTFGDGFKGITNEKRRAEVHRHMENILEPIRERMVNIIKENWNAINRMS